jgi:hypothetical protein
MRLWDGCGTVGAWIVHSDMYMNLVMAKKPAVFLPVSAIYFALLVLEMPKQSGRILANIKSIPANVHRASTRSNFH